MEPITKSEYVSKPIFNLGPQQETRVLVIYTGGTIGMLRNSEGVYAPMAKIFEKKIRCMTYLHDEQYHEVRFSNNDSALLVLPPVDKSRRVLYRILEYESLLDSSNMTFANWISIAEDIAFHYENYNGFVILHGTDTLSYTASALSFILENLGKPVIITGSQIPVFEVRSDGRDNFIGSLLLAGNTHIPEVCVYFQNALFRGNRTVKVNVSKFNAFESPNYPHLVDIDIDINVHDVHVYKNRSSDKFVVHSKLNPNVMLLRYFPSLTLEIVTAFLSMPSLEGIVLQCYGSGNFPSLRTDILKALKEAIERGIIILSTSQCLSGAVGPFYETGKVLSDIGVISGRDITAEAAYTKLSYVLSKSELSIENKKTLLNTDIAGEMTVISTTKSSSFQNFDFFDVLPSWRNKNKDFDKMLHTSIVNYFILHGNQKELKSLKLNPNINLANIREETPLHVAVRSGSLSMVSYFLEEGFNIHGTDMNNENPLQVAIRFAHSDIIGYLVEKGAHLVLSSSEIGEILCSAARTGNLTRILAYEKAGVDLNSPNIVGQNVCHAAVEANKIAIVRSLLEKTVDWKARDRYNRSPIDIAHLLGYKGIIEVLKVIS